MLVNCEPWSIARKAIAKQMPRGGVDQDFVFWLSPPYGHEQGLQNQISGLPALNGPAHNTPGVQVNNYGQIGKTLIGLDIGNVGDPDPIWGANFKLPCQGVVDSD